MTALTPREQQVCDLLVHGDCNKEIARKLGISIRTVEDFRSQVLCKCEVRNVVELVLKVYGLGKFNMAGEPNNEQVEEFADA